MQSDNQLPTHNMSLSDFLGYHKQFLREQILENTEQDPEKIWKKLTLIITEDYREPRLLERLFGRSFANERKTVTVTIESLDEKPWWTNDIIIFNLDTGKKHKDAYLCWKAENFFDGVRTHVIAPLEEWLA